MNVLKKPKNSFGKALKTARLAQGMSQEDFSLVSSRTYVSSLERGIKEPTIGNVEQLAEALNVHPLTLLFLSYVADEKQKSVLDLTNKVSSEILRLLKFKQHEASNQGISKPRINQPPAPG